MTIAEELVKVIHSSQKGEARSNQKAIGPSEIGGCARKTWLRLNDGVRTNAKTLRLASVMGTAIHSYIQQAFEKQDPFKERYMLEVEVTKDDLMGHVDLYDMQNQEVVDWKTVKKKGLSYFPSQSQIWQVQLYGYLLQSNGHPVKNVTLVAIPRDGDERDIVYHTEPYDFAVVEQALNWLAHVKSATEMPAPEKDPSFCKYYCSFYDETGEVGCSGGRRTRRSQA